MSRDGKEYFKAYREAHKEELATKKKAYREAHKEEMAARDKAYYEAHKEEIAAKKKAYNEAYREAHKEEIAARNKAYNEAHKEERAARKKAYDEAHKEEIAVRKKAYDEAYREAHKEELNAKRRERRKRKREGETYLAELVEEPLEVLELASDIPNVILSAKPDEHHNKGQRIDSLMEDLLLAEFSTNKTSLFLKDKLPAKKQVILIDSVDEEDIFVKRIPLRHGSEPEGPP